MHNKKTADNKDDIAATLRHAEIIRKKPFFKKLYKEFYTQFNELTPKIPGDGFLVELGSGPGFIKDVIQEVTTSDVLELPGVDKIFTALNMPFEDNSIRAIFMLNTLHHINDVEKIFKETERCLKIGGKLVAIEPANTFWSRFIYQKIHHEQFDPSGPWHFKGDSPLSSSNGAIPWIVFCRDRATFEKKFPSLKVLSIRLHTPFRYIISGGFSIGQLLPSFTFNTISYIEKFLSPLNRHIAMFQTIEIVKVKIW